MCTYFIFITSHRLYIDKKDVFVLNVKSVKIVKDFYCNNDYKL